MTLLGAVIFFTVGCSGIDRTIEEVDDVGHGVEEVVGAGAGAVDAAGEAAEEVGEAAGEVKWAGQQVRGLRDKQLNLELQKSARLKGTNVQVRPVGANTKKVLPAGDFLRYGVPVSRFVDEATFSVYTEIDGRGAPVKVRREYYKGLQAGSTLILVLVANNEGNLLWVPPSERGNDETIEYDNH
jgi:hypothetical protein